MKLPHCYLAASDCGPSHTIRDYLPQLFIVRKTCNLPHDAFITSSDVFNYLSLSAVLEIHCSLILFGFIDHLMMCSYFMYLTFFGYKILILYL